MRIPIILLAVLLAAACGKRPKPKFVLPVEPKEPVSERLHTATESAYAQKPCNSIVANEWGHTWPVPLAGKEARYSILYYPAPGGFDQPFEVYPPAAKATIDENLGGPVACERLPGDGPPLGKGLYPPETMKLKRSEFIRRLNRLFDRTEKVGALYRSGGTPDKALLNEYFNLFQQLAEPEFKSEYYRQNPEFWEWLRQAIGRSLPKP